MDGPLTDVGVLVQRNSDRENFCILIYVPVSLLLCFFNVKIYFRGFRSHQKALYFGVFGGKMAKIGYFLSAKKCRSPHRKWLKIHSVVVLDVKNDISLNQLVILSFKVIFGFVKSGIFH